MMKLPFRDRVEAGRLLNFELAKRGFGGRENTIVLALPRGGVVTGAAMKDLPPIFTTGL